MEAIKIKNLRYPGDSLYSYKNFIIKISVDEDPVAPDEYSDDYMFVVSDYKNFCVKSDYFDVSDIREVLSNSKSNFVEGYWVFPISIYDHSGISLSLANCQGWDISNGWAYACIKRSKGFCYTKAKAFEIAKPLVESWNNYLSGEIYRYDIEEIDSMDSGCGNFVGSEGIEEALSEAESVIDSKIDNILKKHIKKLKNQIRNGAPLYARKEFSYGSKNVL